LSSWRNRKRCSADGAIVHTAANAANLLQVAVEALWARLVAGLAVHPLVSLVAVAVRVFGVATRSLTGGAFLGLGYVIRDLLGRRLLGHLIRGLADVGARRTHRFPAYPHS
jgi:hypothetical protein